MRTGRSIDSLPAHLYAAFVAGKCRVRRDENLESAKNIKDCGLKKLFIKLARHHHREMICELRQAKSLAAAISAARSGT